VNDDPYSLLGIDTDASDSELKLAYERRIAEAARLDALKLMAEIDRAYTVLRDPRRRALFDRHGLWELPRREHPMHRWSPPAAVPFRAWSPTVTAPVTRGAQPVPGTARQRCVRAGLIGLTISAGIALVPLAAHHLRSATGSGPGSSSTQIRVVCQPGPNLPGYSYVTVSGSSVGCSNGATPTVQDVEP
jgi:curved DNA-binding protein CbpA